MKTAIRGTQAPSTVSVCTIVANGIAHHRPDLANLWLRLSCRDITDGFPIEQQIDYVNDFWRLRLSFFPSDVNTMDARASLISVPFDAWWQNFQEDILPLIIEHWDGV